MDTSPSTGTPQDAPARPRTGLATELRDSVLLLGLSLGVTVGLTAAAQAVLGALG